MAEHYDGYLTFGTKIDETGFEKGVLDMKSLANLSAKAVSTALTGSTGTVSLFAASVAKGMEKMTEQAVLLLNLARENGVQSSSMVERAMSELEKTVESISEGALQNAKERAGSYKELGALYLNYMKEGMEEKVSDTVTWMQWQVDRNVEAFAAENKKGVPAYRKAAKELMAVYKEELKSGMDEAYILVSNRIEEITLEAQAQYSKLFLEKQQMEEKLSAYGKLFSYDQEGEVQLEKIGRQIETMEEYAEVLGKLREKGISEGLFDEILGMDLNDGTAFGEELLQKSDTFFEEYSKLWDEKQELARELAAKFYDSELEALDEDFTSELDKALYDIPNICQEVGVDAMRGVVNGMESRREEAVATARSIADAIIAELKRATETASPSKRAAREVGKPLTQGIIKGMKDAYDPKELQSYTDRMIADIGHSQAKAAQSVSYLNTSSVVNSATYNSGGNLTVTVDKIVNDGKGTVKSAMQEFEFYRRQQVTATGGA